MKVLVCGSRHWTNEAVIRRELERLPSETVIIEGGASGADSIARAVAHALGFTVLEHKAAWNTFGRAAGPIRNQQMLDENKPELVLAFTDDQSARTGTADMLRRAERAGITYTVYDSSGRIAKERLSWQAPPQHGTESTPRKE
jgi:YspA, cpYpsA-related SLOG family